ncbi:Homeobox protein HAZ1, partial [Bienertia sinuspersici]
IFCAKCGSKELPVGNDIILCDGICERGFHQYCLDPPLKTEEIPPGDEGWLCPSCDCKHDCIDFINDYQGTKLSIEDSWEKVFPEAVSGKELDDVMGLPSDDSEDDEYNPGATDDDANVEGNESSSDDSDSEKSDSSEFSSVSEDLGAICGAEQNLGLPSDDSEDDDFDPDAKNVNEEGIEHESSSSDFTSASEDLGAAIGDDGASDKDEPPQPMALEQDLGESSPITSKRCVERLDYKKLYDETYGDDTLESSDDEEWEDMVPTRKRKGSTEKSVSPSSLGASASADGTCGSGAPRRRGRPKANLQVANGSPVQLQESSQKTTSGGSGRKRPPYSRLGEAVTQRLYASFKENQYPDREAKEKLANELGLTAHRVDKWFGNARWSFHHHPSRVEASISRAVSQSNTNSVACNGDESALASDAAALPECGSTDTTKSPNSQKHAPRNSRKNNKEGNQPMLETTNTENSTEGTQNTTEGTQTDPLHTPDTSQGRKQRKRRKLGA